MTWRDPSSCLCCTVVVYLCCTGAVSLAQECSLCVPEEYLCLWQDCGFCSLESSADLVRHVYFHCYHTKLKQWGLRALQSQADVSHCQLDFQSRNIIPEIQENFLCLWEYCEVRRGGLGVKGAVLQLPCTAAQLLALFGAVWEQLWACFGLLHPVLCVLAPLRGRLTTPSGSTGTWRITASAPSTRQQGRRTTWCSVAGKVCGSCRAPPERFGLAGKCGTKFQRAPRPLEIGPCMVLSMKYSCKTSFRECS